MKIFLSHASENKDIVRQFKSHMPDHVQVWLDEKELTVGSWLSASIEDAITKECDFFVVFLGRDAQQSDWVKREIELALQREKDIDRTFLLPILLEEMDGNVLGINVREKFYSECYSRSPTGIAGTAQKFLADLFKLISAYIEGNRIPPAWYCLREMQNDLMEYKRLAYMLHASLGDSIRVLSSNEDAFDSFATAVGNYNDFTDKFILRLPNFINRMRSYWNDTDVEDTAKFFRYIQKEAYHGKIYALNDIREKIMSIVFHKDGDRDQLLDADEFDHKKDQLLGNAIVVLENISSRSLKTIDRLKKNMPKSTKERFS